MNSARRQLSPVDEIDKRLMQVKHWLLGMDDDDNEQQRAVWFFVELGVRFPEFRTWHRTNTVGVRKKPKLQLVQSL